MFKILSLDGGGVRGLLTVTILERLDTYVPGFLARADLYAGTSTGGILALGLAHGLKPRELRELYERTLPSTFTAPLWQRVVGARGLCGPRYTARALERELRKVFGGTRLDQLKHYVLIPAIDLAAESLRHGVFAKPKFFHNLPGTSDALPGHGSDGAESVADVALYTSAAPTYFPAPAGYADGGLVANSPALCAAAQALDPRHFRPPRGLHELVVFSVGTGRTLVRVGRGGWLRRGSARSNRWWGLLQWGKPAISIMMDGMFGTTDYICRNLLGERYLRLEYVFQEAFQEEGIALDAWERAADLVSMAGTVDLSAAAAWLEHEWR